MLNANLSSFEVGKCLVDLKPVLLRLSIELTFFSCRQQFKKLSCSFVLPYHVSQLRQLRTLQLFPSTARETAKLMESSRRNTKNTDVGNTKFGLYHFVCFIDLHSTTQVVSSLHATVLGKSCMCIVYTRLNIER
jgi:hypothetical protein